MEGPTAMLGIATPVLRISDSAASTRFYCDQLGFAVEFAVRGDESQADPCYMSVVRDGARLHLSSHSGDGVFGGVVHVAAVNVDVLHRELRDRGVAIHLPPIDQTWGVREMYVRDPDGNTLRFASPS